MTDELMFPNRALVRVLSPVHIGTGDKLGNLAFVRDGHDMVVLNEDRLAAWAGSNDRLGSQFVAIAEAMARALLIEDKTEQRQKRLAIARQLHDLLKASGRPLNELFDYRVGVNTPEALEDVMTFIKTAGQKPYLPGSSLKGSLRSAILRGALNLQPDRTLELSDAIEPLAETGRPISDELQSKVFVPARVDRNKWSNYDLNRSVSISDSRLKEPDDLEVVEVKIYSTQMNDTLKSKPWSIFAETLRVGTQLRLSLTRAAYLLAGLAPADQLRFRSESWMIVELAALCRAAALDIIEQEIQFYHDYHEPDAAGWYESKRDELKAVTDQRFMLPLGWGSGYDAKTVTDLLSDAMFGLVAENYRNTKGLGRAGNRRSSPWLGPELSPKSRKLVHYYTGPNQYELLPVGWVVVKLDAGDEPPGLWKDLTEEALTTINALQAKLVETTSDMNAGPEADRPAAATPTTAPANTGEVSEEAKSVKAFMDKKAAKRAAQKRHQKKQ